MANEAPTRAELAKDVKGLTFAVAALFLTLYLASKTLDNKASKFSHDLLTRRVRELERIEFERQAAKWKEPKKEKTA